MRWPEFAPVVVLPTAPGFPERYGGHVDPGAKAA
jgi:hypothetical protein